jgi:hypothetical protein
MGKLRVESHVTESGQGYFLALLHAFKDSEP